MTKRIVDKIYFTKEQIDVHRELITKEYQEIRKLEGQISQHKKRIEEIQLVLINNCNHNKVPDRSCYDHTTYYCDICGQDLWNF